MAISPDLPGEFAAHMAAVARGDKPLPSSIGDRHHFIPEFILRRFRGRTARGKRLFVLDKRDGSITETTPKEAGWEHRLYSVSSIDGKHDGFVEALFGLAENYAATSLQALLGIHQSPSLSADDRGNLAYLIAAQQQRVPGALEELRLNMVIAGSTFAAVELANLKGSKRKQRQGLEGYEALVAGQVSLQPSSDAVLEMAIISLANTAHTIFDLPWTLLRAKPDAASFVCSDRPLTMFDPTPPHKFSAPGWISSGNVAAAMPLSASSCVRISPRDRAAFSIRQTARQVERINRFTYGYADRWVYVVDDALGDIALALTRRGATGAGATGCVSAHRALWRRRALLTVTPTELLDLDLKPGQTLLQIGALGFKRVDDLLHARQANLSGRETWRLRPRPRV